MRECGEGKLIELQMNSLAGSLAESRAATKIFHFSKKFLTTAFIFFRYRCDWCCTGREELHSSTQLHVSGQLQYIVDNDIDLLSDNNEQYLYQGTTVSFIRSL